nr:hypothetical protein [Lysobacter enzymogenes]
MVVGPGPPRRRKALKSTAPRRAAAGRAAGAGAGAARRARADRQRRRAGRHRPRRRAALVRGRALHRPARARAGLWLPTTQRPQLPLDLLQRALARRHPQSPLLMLREPARLVPLHRALPASDELIAQIRARWQD